MRKTKKEKLAFKKTKIHQWKITAALKGGTSANSLPSETGLKVYLSYDLPEYQCL